MCLSAQLGSHASSAERFCGAGEGRGEATGGKNREIKEHNNTFLIIYHVPPCGGSSRGPKQNNNKSGWGGVGCGGVGTCFVFAGLLCRQVRSGLKIRKGTGLPVSLNRFLYYTYTYKKKKKKILWLKNIVFVTAKENIWIASIYE